MKTVKAHQADGYAVLTVSEEGKPDHVFSVQSALTAYQCMHEIKEGLESLLNEPAYVSSKSKAPPAKDSFGA